MQEKYNVFIRYSGDDEFKFVVKKIGEVNISKNKPVYIYNADLDVIESLRLLRKMRIEITIGAKPTGAFKVYNLEDYDRKTDRLADKRFVMDRRGYEPVSNDEVSNILSSANNGPIEIEEPKVEEPKVEEPKVEETKIEEKQTKKTKKSTKKATKKK